uniref:Ventrally expressed dharma/bozozok antagonist n=1 Tax=Hippocampus comes TaxID=109280 RepID=A0A3Q2Z170_HIPCM
MRGHFSIEWMAQSSRQRPASISGGGTARLAAPGLAGTHAESLPGFCRRPDHDGGGVPGKRPKMDSDDNTSEAEEETSGYESERSLSPLGPADDAATACASPLTPPSGRRPRTAFTVEQIGSLERAFKRNAYLGTQDKAQLCRKLNLSDKQIRNWFQNRRMKLKRTVQDALAHACQASAASHFAPYPELQAYRPAPYPRYHPMPLTLQDAGGATAAALAQPPHNLQYASPLDSIYQYGNVAGAMLSAATPPPPAPPPLMAAYPAYPQYY